MLSVLSRKGNDEKNIISVLGICGMFLLGPIGYFSIGNIFLKSIISGNYYFDASVTNFSSIVSEINLLYLFALAGAIPCLVLGLMIGKSSGNKVLGMELGLITGMWSWLIFVFISAQMEISFYSLLGVVVGVSGSFVGRKIGRYAGKIIVKKIQSK